MFVPIGSEVAVKAGGVLLSVNKVRRKFGTLYGRRRRRSVSPAKYIVGVVVFAVLLSACSPGQDGLTRFEDSPAISVSVLSPESPPPFPISVVFSEPDITTLGLQAEAPIAFLRDGGLGTEVLEARVKATEVFVRYTEEPVDIGCFEAPIDIRNDNTGETLLSITDFCPSVGTVWSLRAMGIYEGGFPLGWSYGGTEGTINVVVGEPETSE